MREHLLELCGFWTYWARMVQYCIGTSINTRPHLPGTCRGDTAVCAHLVRASLFSSSSKLFQDNNLNMCLSVSVSLDTTLDDLGGSQGVDRFYELTGRCSEARVDGGVLQYTSINVLNLIYGNTAYVSARSDNYGSSVY